MSTISQPHDGIFKTLLSDITVVRDFLAAHLPPSLLAYCDLSTLQLESSAFIEEKMQQHFSDMVYSMRAKRGRGYIYIILEHQSKGERMMPLRMLRYQLSAMQKHLDQKRSKRLPIVIPIVLYHGPKNRSYPHSLDMLDCFEQPELAREIFLGPIQLIDLSLIPDEELRMHEGAAVLEMVLKHIRTKDLVLLLQDVMPLLEKYPLSIDKERAIFHYLLNTGKCKDQGQLIAFFDEYGPYYGEHIMTFGQLLRREAKIEGRKEGLEEGREEGREVGREVGREEGIRGVAIKMLEVGMSGDQIKTLTGLDAEEITRLAVELGAPTLH